MLANKTWSTKNAYRSQTISTIPCFWLYMSYNLLHLLSTNHKCTHAYFIKINATQKKDNCPEFNSLHRLISARSVEALLINSLLPSSDGDVLGVAAFIDDFP
jgi:hypothetical protein